MAHNEDKLIIKDYGLVEKSTNPYDIHKAIHNKRQSLCWECANGYPDKCKKVADLIKESIVSYDFITKGFQIVQDGKMQYFIVEGCSNFKVPSPKIKTTPEEMRKLRDSLAMYTYNTADASQARRLTKSRYRRY